MVSKTRPADPAMVLVLGLALLGAHVFCVSRVAGQEPASPPRSTTFYDLAVEHVALPPVESRRGSIAKVGDLVVYAAQKGHLYVIADMGMSMRELDLAIPLRYEHPFLAGGNPAWVSVFDLAAEPSASGPPGHHDLYASYLEVDDTGPCIVLALSKATVAVVGDVLRAVTGWKEVFRAEPCVAHPSTNSTGGRIDFDADGILLTVGTFNAIAGDYGTIVRLDRTTFEKRTISNGHRNPQGLFVDGAGTIFETEHGPRGGDELNVIEEGKNYGWPAVTYGTDYEERDYCEVRPCDPGSPPESQGRHLGFEQPLYAFVPSVGLSQVIQVTQDREFPIWQGDLLVASIAGESLHRVHLYEGRVVVVEPIRLGSPLRDMIEMDDGRIAILTDERELLIVSNAAGPNLQQ